MSDQTFDDQGPIEDENLEQLDQSDTLDTSAVDDPLDTGYSPPDTDRGSRAFGVTAAEQHREEPLEERIRQEVPDPNSAAGAPDNESGLDEPLVGGDDPDAIAAEDDWLGDAGGRPASGPAGSSPTTRGRTRTTRASCGAGTSASTVRAASAEEAAVHIVDDESEPDEG